MHKNIFFMNGQTRRFGIIGVPLRNTLSPLMHNALFQQWKVPAIYFPLEITANHFESLVPKLRHVFEGFNVTVPYKEKIIPFLEGVTDSAKKIGAVNTVFFKEKKWMGDNTDWKGFQDSLRFDYGIPFKNKNVLILGGGGSAKACFYAALWGAAGSITMMNRTPEKNDLLMEQNAGTSCLLRSVGISELNVCAQQAQIIINATSLGLNPNDKHFFDFTRVSPKTFAYDLIYGKKTDFLKRAKKRGCSVGDGLGMLIRQGALAFQRWTGKKPNLEFMRKSLTI
jgi:shikimate dehydrogenase